MKKVAGGAVAAATALVLTACGGGGTEGAGASSPAGGGQEEASVTLWMYPVIPDPTSSQEFWDGVEQDFEAANANVDLTIELLPWDARDEKIATAIASGTGPDLVLLTPDMTLNYHETGGLKPISDVIDAQGAYFEDVLKSVTYDGEIYGWPIYQTSTTTAYNKALFDEAGITELPDTWEEVKAAAPKLAANDVAILDYTGSPNMTLNLSFYPLLWQAGGTVFTPDGKDVAFDGPEGVAALQFLLDLQEMGGLPPDAATKENAIEGGPLGNGTAAMGYNLDPSQVGLLQAAHGEENIVVGQPLMGEQRVSFGTPGILALTTINEDEAAAAKVANYIASAQVSHDLQVASGTFPVREDSGSPGDDPVTQAFLDALQYATPGEVVPNARQVMAALVPEIQAALQGQKTAEQALSDAATEARGIIGRAG